MKTNANTIENIMMSSPIAYGPKIMLLVGFFSNKLKRESHGDISIPVFVARLLLDGKVWEQTNV